MPDPQNYANHTRLDPPFHFVLIPLLVLNLAFSIYVTVHHWPQHRALFGWWIVMSLVLIGFAIRMRTYTLRAQDRLIRLEERLRLGTMLAPADLPQIGSLSVSQLVALRFASDAELPALARRTVAENLTSKQIKQSIADWRADNFRV